MRYDKLIARCDADERLLRKMANALPSVLDALTPNERLSHILHAGVTAHRILSKQTAHETMSQELFTTGHPGTPPRPANDAKDTRDLSYKRLRGHLDGQRLRYLDAVVRVARHGLKTQDGTTIHDLTDAEAAKLLGIGRSSVTGRRAELIGGSGAEQRFVVSPAVVKSERRTCHVTGSMVTPWKPSPQLKLDV